MIVPGLTLEWLRQRIPEAWERSQRSQQVCQTVVQPAPVLDNESGVACVETVHTSTACLDSRVPRA